MSEQITGPARVASATAEPAREKVRVSVLIPVKNEAANLARCLTAIQWADEVFVVDSASADGTQEIATQFGAKVVQFEFCGTWPKKKNWALENLPFQHAWIFIVDADEVIQPGAEAEIRDVVEGRHSEYFAGYWINRRFMFMDRWLRHAYYPNWNLRLFKHAVGRYEMLTDADTRSGDNEVHEHVLVDGPTGFLKTEMDHYAFPSIDVFVEKHNRYSNWEAQVAIGHHLDSGSNLQKSGVKWRRRIKRWSHLLPCRPLLRFMYVYLWQGGILDGLPGYYFARLHGFYEFLCVAKSTEARRRVRAVHALAASSRNAK